MEEVIKSFKDSQESQEKKIRQVNETLQDLKIEIEAIKKPTNPENTGKRKFE